MTITKDAITVWRTADGREHRTESSARAHDARRALTDFLTRETVRYGLKVERQTVTWILANGDELERLLHEYNEWKDCLVDERPS